MWIAVESYTAQCGDELTYQAGDDVEVLATSNLGWWKIRYRNRVTYTKCVAALGQDRIYLLVRES